MFRIKCIFAPTNHIIYNLWIYGFTISINPLNL